MKIIPLSEGAFTIDQSKKFVPFEVGADDLQARSRGSLLVEIQPFVVLTGEDTVLFDTGLGFRSADGTLQIHRNLVNAGINPMDVTKVLLSHLHKDHAGGIGVNPFSFPSAIYYIQGRELAYGLEKGPSSYILEELAPLRGTDRVVLLDNDGGHIGRDIRYEVTGGHTPFHQVFWIGEGGQTAFFGGDDAPQLNQMKNRFIAKYDFDGKKCMELRKKWWQEAESGHWTLMFYHDVKYPTVRL